jgi:hypothetical protein
LETVYVDLDDDEVDDISLTYLGMVNDKADVRIRLVPKYIEDIGGEEESYIAELEERIPIALEPKKRHIHLAEISLIVFAVAGLILLLTVSFRWIYLHTPLKYKIDKFLYAMRIKKLKRGG